MVRELYKKIEGYDQKLKTCPFCGSRAELWEYSPTANVFSKAVMCSNSGDDYHEGECPMYMPNEGFYKSTKREAIEAWNKRNIEEK